MKIEKPTLLLWEDRARNNILKMVEKSRRSRVRFRPHFKSHQSTTIGEWLQEYGVKEITVSSLDMASYFAEHGWSDITVAFPVNIPEMEKINRLASRITLHLLVESTEAVNFLSANLSHPVNIWIKIDVGYHRTGIEWEQSDRILALAKRIQKSQHLSFRGILTHAGHAYHAREKTEILAVYQQTLTRMKSVQSHLLVHGIHPVEISIGDTPTCSLRDDFSGVDEIRPGNFVFYDAMQWQMGVCQEDQIAVALACPVVAKHPRREEVVIYGGAIHLSKEYLVDNRGIKIFGYVAPLQGGGWSEHFPDTYVKSLSQEHGIIKTTTAILKNIKIGEILVILPIHSCLTVNLMGKLLTLKGEQINTMRLK